MITAKVEMRVYFNLIHNLLLRHFQLEDLRDMERKSAHIPMSLGAFAGGELKEPGQVTLQFGEHEVDFGFIETKLREHYKIPDESYVYMAIPSSLAGRTIENPVYTSMDVVYEESFED